MIFPSRTETLGLTALESFASGVPVIGARAGGLPFVIDDGRTGRLVDSTDPLQWAQAICDRPDATARPIDAWPSLLGRRPNSILGNSLRLN